MKLTKDEIKQYQWPDDFIRVWPTVHSINRLTERGLGLEFIPNYVKMTPTNVHAAEMNDSNKLKSVVIKLLYGRYKWLFLVINPRDGAIKTIWFRDRKVNYGNRRIEDKGSDNK